jgi:tetratricopeptide (TPR) repeat protein
LEWTEQVSQEQVCQGNVCELSYPEDKPVLQPGVSYKLVVKADTNRSSTEDIPPGFTTLDEQEAEEVRTIAQQIEEEDLPATAKIIELADYYADRNLIAEAIEILEGLAQEEKSVAVYRRLGDLYSSIGLTREAEVAYNEAIQLPEAAEDIQELAAVKAGLGEVKFALNDKDEAIRLLEEAKVDYENLGDAQRAEEVKERIAEISAM